MSVNINFASVILFIVFSVLESNLPVWLSLVSIISRIPSFCSNVSGIDDVILYPFKSNITLLLLGIVITISWLVNVAFLNNFIVVCSSPTAFIASSIVGYVISPICAISVISLDNVNIVSYSL